VQRPGPAEDPPAGAVVAAGGAGPGADDPSSGAVDADGAEGEGSDDDVLPVVPPAAVSPDPDPQPARTTSAQAVATTGAPPAWARRAGAARRRCPMGYRVVI
jgi:hypothetical protein